jgi:hypothetical protein
MSLALRAFWRSFPPKSERARRSTLGWTCCIALADQTTSKEEVEREKGLKQILLALEVEVLRHELLQVVHRRVEEPEDVIELLNRKRIE